MENNTDFVDSFRMLMWAWLRQRYYIGVDVGEGESKTAVMKINKITDKQC